MPKAPKNAIPIPILIPSPLTVSQVRRKWGGCKSNSDGTDQRINQSCGLSWLSTNQITYISMIGLKITSTYLNFNQHFNNPGKVRVLKTNSILIPTKQGKNTNINTNFETFKINWTMYVSFIYFWLREEFKIKKSVKILAPCLQKWSEVCQNGPPKPRTLP